MKQAFLALFSKIKHLWQTLCKYVCRKKGWHITRNKDVTGDGKDDVVITTDPKYYDSEE